MANIQFDRWTTYNVRPTYLAYFIYKQRFAVTIKLFDYKNTRGSTAGWMEWLNVDIIGNVLWNQMSVFDLGVSLAITLSNGIRYLEQIVTESEETETVSFNQNDWFPDFTHVSTQYATQYITICPLLHARPQYSILDITTLKIPHIWFSCFLKFLIE